MAGGQSVCVWGRAFLTVVAGRLVSPEGQRLWGPTSSKLLLWEGTERGPREQRDTAKLEAVLGDMLPLHGVYPSQVFD